MAQAVTHRPTTRASVRFARGLVGTNLDDAHHFLLLLLLHVLDLIEAMRLLVAARIGSACVELQQSEIGGVVVRIGMQGLIEIR